MENQTPRLAIFDGGFLYTSCAALPLVERNHDVVRLQAIEPSAHHWNALVNVVRCEMDRGHGTKPSPRARGREDVKKLAIGCSDLRNGQVELIRPSQSFNCNPKSHGERHANKMASDGGVGRSDLHHRPTRRRDDQHHAGWSSEIG
jgi:hypothetical protein